MKQLHFWKHLGMLVLLLLTASALDAQDRIYARSSYRYSAATQSFTAQDSTRFEYLGARGSDFTDFYGDYGADKSSTWFYRPATNQYEETSRGFNIHDNNGNVTLHTDFFIIGGVQQDTDRRTEYTYNANNKVVSAISYRKYSPTQWEGLSNTTYTYDGQGNIAETVRKKWQWDINTNSYAWHNDRRTVNTYANGKLTEELAYDWDGSTWVFSSRNSYRYIGNNLDSSFTEFYNIPASQWQYSHGSAYTYNANNDNDTTTFFSYNASLSKWEANLRSVSTYDNNHNLLTAINQIFVGGVFENDMRQQTTYNANNLQTFSVMDYWNKQSGQFEYLEESLKTSSMSFWHYEPVTASIAHLNSNPQFSIYPNPASSEIHINLQLPKGSSLLNFAIYDQSGKIIRHWHEPYSAVYSKTIDVSTLTDGIYYMRCINAGLTQKFIVTH